MTVYLDAPERWQYRCPRGHQSIRYWFPETGRYFCSNCQHAYTASAIEGAEETTQNVQC